jgi:hypothetical protein
VRTVFVGDADVGLGVEAVKLAGGGGRDANQLKKVLICNVWKKCLSAKQYFLKYSFFWQPPAYLTFLVRVRGGVVEEGALRCTDR